MFTVFFDCAFCFTSCQCPTFFPSEFYTTKFQRLSSENSAKKMFFVSVWLLETKVCTMCCFHFRRHCLQNEFKMFNDWLTREDNWAIILFVMMFVQSYFFLLNPLNVLTSACNFVRWLILTTILRSYMWELRSFLKMKFYLKYNRIKIKKT